MYIKQNVGQNVHVSISKEIFFIQISMHKNHNPMLMINGTLYIAKENKVN